MSKIVLAGLFLLLVLSIGLPTPQQATWPPPCSVIHLVPIWSTGAYTLVPQDGAIDSNGVLRVGTAEYQCELEAAPSISLTTAQPNARQATWLPPCSVIHLVPTWSTGAYTLVPQDGAVDIDCVLRVGPFEYRGERELATGVHYIREVGRPHRYPFYKDSTYEFQVFTGYAWVTMVKGDYAVE